MSTRYVMNQASRRACDRWHGIVLVVLAAVLLLLPVLFKAGPRSCRMCAAPVPPMTYHYSQ
jgi:hypothetical protein